MCAFQYIPLPTVLGWKTENIEGSCLRWPSYPRMAETKKKNHVAIIINGKRKYKRRKSPKICENAGEGENEGKINPSRSNHNKQNMHHIIQNPKCTYEKISIRLDEKIEKALESIQKHIVLYTGGRRLWNIEGEVYQRRRGDYMCNQNLKGRSIGFDADILWKKNFKVESRKDSTWNRRVAGCSDPTENKRWFRNNSGNEDSTVELVGLRFRIVSIYRQKKT